MIFVWSMTGPISRHQWVTLVAMIKDGVGSPQSGFRSTLGYGEM